MKKVVKISALLLLGVGIPAYSVLADTKTVTFNVNASVGQSCTISATSDLNFGEVSTTADTTGQAILSVTCTPAAGTIFTIGLDNGLNSSGTPDSRSLANSSNKISYNLFRSSDYASVWGDTVASRFQGIGTTTPTAVTVYGKITKPDTTPVAGVYSDKITATIYY